MIFIQLIGSISYRWLWWVNVRFAKRKPHADERNALLVINYIVTTGNTRKRNVTSTHTPIHQQSIRDLSETKADLRVSQSRRHTTSPRSNRKRRKMVDKAIAQQQGTSNGKMQEARRIHGVGACFLTFSRARRIVAKSATEHMSAVRASARSHKP